VQVLQQLIVEEEGAEIAEYALLVVILALGLLAAMPSLKDALLAAFSNTGGKVSTNASSLAALP
jgi:Flp pilus assembly pilin Flp